MFLIIMTYFRKSVIELMVKYSSNESSSRMTIDYNHFLFGILRENKEIHLMLEFFINIYENI